MTDTQPRSSQTQASGGALRFGRFRFEPDSRALFDGEAPVRIGARALDLLAALLEHAGELVGRETLMAAAWPGLAVEDINLRVQITALRKVLGDGQAGARFIVAVPGRGYQFTAPVARAATLPAPPAASPRPPSPGLPSNLPQAPAHIVGRERAIAAIARQLTRQRLLTVVGPGGVGKTTVALAAAARWREAEGLPVTFVDLQALSSPAATASAIGAQLRAPALASDTAAGLAAFLADRQGLIILDNCEHLVDAVATLAEAIIAVAPGVSLLATSREPLRAEGEWLHHLASLAAPPARAGLTSAKALTFPAVELFVDRVAAHIHDFALGDDEADAAAEICRRLDGMPLAIELAAARVEMFGVAGLASRLDARFAILTAGRRTALPRHQTLRATLDWSYDLLSEAERTTLRRLAVFAGAFSIDAAGAVAMGDDLPLADALEAAMGLADKSLLAIDAAGETVCFRLLETTRAYAQERLSNPAEREAARARHAARLLDTLRTAEDDWARLPLQRWLAMYTPMIDDVRAALDWADGEGGDVRLGAELVILGAGLAQLLSLYAEFHARALAALRRLTPGETPILEARLNLALGNLSFNLFGPTDGLAALFQRALELSDGAGDDAGRLDALAGMWLWAYAAADYPAAQGFVERMLALQAGGDLSRRRTIERMEAVNLYFLGNPAAAWRNAGAALDDPPTRVRPSFRVTVQLDREVTMRIVRARSAWLLGRADDARDIAAEALTRAQRYGDLVESTLGFCILPVALWRGDRADAEAIAARLAQVAAAGEASIWRAWSRAYAILLDPARTDEAAALETWVDNMQLDTMATLHPAVGGPRALARAEHGIAPWCAAEVFRTAGLRRAQQEAEAGEALVRKALDLAEAQGALAWRLRAACSLTELRRGRDSRGAVAARLGPLIERHVQGLDTADLRWARTLLNAGS